MMVGGGREFFVKGKSMRELWNLVELVDGEEDGDWVLVRDCLGKIENVLRGIVVWCNWER